MTKSFQTVVKPGDLDKTSLVKDVFSLMKDKAETKKRHLNRQQKLNDAGKKPRNIKE